MAQLRPLPPKAGAPPPLPDQSPVVPLLTPPGNLPKVVIPAHLKEKASPRSSPSASPGVVVPGGDELDAELAHLREVCDPTPWEQQSRPEHAPDDPLDGIPDAIVAGDDVDSEPDGGPPPLPVAPHHRIPIVFAVGAVVLLLLGLSAFVGMRALFRQRKAAIIEAVEELPPVGEVAPVAMQPELPADSELAAFRALETDSPTPAVLSPEQAAAVGAYLRDFPDGLHHDDVLAYAIRQSYRAFLPDSGVAGEARTCYRQLGRQALLAMLDRNRVGLEARQLLIAFCKEQPDAMDIRLAEQICRLYPSESVQNAWLCISILDAQPEGVDLSFFQLAFYDAVAATPVEQWHHVWLDRFAVQALAVAQACERPSEQLLSVCRSLQFVGRTKDAVQIVAVLARNGVPDTIRPTANRWRMCWDEAYADKVRQSALRIAGMTYRTELPKALQGLDRPGLARAQGLPWPLPAPPTRPAEDIRKDAAAAAVAEALKQFPDSRLAEIRQEAEERFRPHEIGQEVTVVLERAFRRTISGTYRSRTQSHVRIGDQDVMLEDIPRDDRIRFDPVWCKEGKEAYVQREIKSLLTRRAACEKRLTEQFSAEALVAGGYVRKGEAWVNPHEVFEQALTEAAETVSRDLRVQTMRDTLDLYGFRAEGGAWVPVPPSEEEEE